MSENVSDVRPFRTEPVPVAVGDVESALNTLWRAAAEAVGPAPVRTTVANLVVYTPNEARDTALTEVIAALASRHPSRAIVLSVNSPGDSLDAWVEMHCQISPGERRQVCGEQISIHAPAQMVDQLPAAVLPLLLSDLPVILYWRAAPDPDNNLLHALVRRADRVILDGALGADVRAVLGNICVLLDRYPRTAICDLDWTRLTVLRELTAQLFDAPDMRPYLDTISEIEIAHDGVGGASPPPQAYLYLGWLASRLSWSVAAPAKRQESGYVTLSLRGAQGPIDVRLLPGAEMAGVPTALAAVSLHAEGTPPARFEIERDREGVCGNTRVHLGEREVLERVMTFSALDEAGALSQEFEVMGRDKAYEEAVRAAAAMVGEES